MNYNELNQDNVRRDGIEQMHIGDVRKPKLTLRHLSKLRKLRELKQLEKENNAKLLALIYAPPPESQSTPGGGSAPF